MSGMLVASIERVVEGCVSLPHLLFDDLNDDVNDADFDGIRALRCGPQMFSTIHKDGRCAQIATVGPRSSFLSRAPRCSASGMFGCTRESHRECDQVLHVTSWSSVLFDAKGTC